VSVRRNGVSTPFGELDEYRKKRCPGSRGGSPPNRAEELFRAYDADGSGSIDLKGAAGVPEQ
jgi:hypothetical protein